MSIGLVLAKNIPVFIQELIVTLLTKMKPLPDQEAAEKEMAIIPQVMVFNFISS